MRSLFQVIVDFSSLYFFSKDESVHRSTDCLYLAQRALAVLDVVAGSSKYIRRIWTGSSTRSFIFYDGTTVRDTMTAPWEVDQCKAYLLVIRLRAECELDHPDWRRLSNGFTAPTLVDKEDWIRELIDEYKLCEHTLKNKKTRGKNGRLKKMQLIDDDGEDVATQHKQVEYFLGIICIQKILWRKKKN